MANPAGTNPGAHSVRGYVQFFGGLPNRPRRYDIAHVQAPSTGASESDAVIVTVPEDRGGLQHRLTLFISVATVSV
jgi:hypothetical protein